MSWKPELVSFLSLCVCVCIVFFNNDFSLCLECEICIYISFLDAFYVHLAWAVIMGRLTQIPRNLQGGVSEIMEKEQSFHLLIHLFVHFSCVFY